MFRHSVCKKEELDILFTDKFEQLKKADKPVKTPKGIQDIIPVQKMAKDGTFEVYKGKFSRMYCFQDINYVTAGTEEQVAILKKYCQLINTIDVEFKITINNRNKNMKNFREEVLYPYHSGEDAFDWIRENYNEMIEEKIVQGRQGIEQERYLTVTVQRKDYEQAKAFFTSLEAGMKQHFEELGSKLEPLDIVERLRVLFNFYRIGEEELFSFDYKTAFTYGSDPKNDICNGFMKFWPGYFETDRKVCRVLFIKRYPSSLRDTFLTEIGNLPIHSMITVDVVPVPKQLATRTLQKKYLGIENDILRQQRVRNKNNDFSSDISYLKKVQKKTIEGVMDDVRENDQNVFFTGVTILLMAEDKKELDSMTETIKNIANGSMCQIELHYYQQKEALNTVLPIGGRQVETMRTMLTRDIAALLPFHVQELKDRSGFWYGINQVSKNLNIADRKKLVNGNGMIFGVPGSGKSYFTKLEMFQVLIGTKDDVIIVDPTLEYFDLAQVIGEEAATVNFSTYTKNYLNPLDMDVWNLDIKDSNGWIRDKAEFMLALCEQCFGEPLNSRHKSIIDRCVRKLYLDIAKAKEKHIPVMSEFHEILLEQPEDEAEDIALGLEIFVNGSMNIFNNQTNVETDTRLTVYGIRDLGKELSAIAMLVMLESISRKIAENAKIGRATWLYIDEMHTLFGEDMEFSGNFVYTLWKKVRKQGGMCTGITQNIVDMLQSYIGTTILNNSEFIALLKQSNLDSQELERVAGIPAAQLKYVSNSPAGTGIIKHGSVIVPFDSRMEKGNNLYKLFNTNMHEKFQMQQ